MQHVSDQHENGAALAERMQPYEPPKVIEYGSLRDITLAIANGSGKNDNANASSKTSL